MLAGAEGNHCHREPKAWQSRPAKTVAPGRFIAVDHLRGFVVLLVVLHHTVLAYCVSGHTDHHDYALSSAPIIDSQRWAGFDLLALLNDSFFMPLMFLLSGLFVWDGLARKGAWLYLRGRLLRLGLPFAVAVLTIVPLAYYPSFRQAGGPPSFVAFWITTVTVGPWPSGPPWFVAVLLLFDALAAVIFILFGRPDPVQASARVATPGLCLSVLLAGSFLAYLPLLARFGPFRWVGIGPLAVQASRMGLYAVYFAAGALLGTAALRSGASPLRDGLARRWPAWVLCAAAAAAVLVGVALAWIAVRTALPTGAWLVAYAVAFITFCAAACFAWSAVFLRFAGHPSAAWDALAANSYGIYLLHYPAVTWVQYGLLPMPAPAAVKAVTTFAVAVLASWAGAVMLRRIPGVSHAL